MLVKVLSRYVAGPAATVALLASFGVFDDMDGGGSSASGNPAEQVLSALSGPLAVAERIAIAGGAELGFSEADIKGMFGSIDSVSFGGGGSGGAAGSAASISAHSGTFKSVRPPAPEPAPE